MVRVFNVPDGWPVPWHSELINTKYISKKSKDHCGYLLLDSDFNEPDTTNEDVVRKGVKFRADAVVPKDYVLECKPTIKSVLEFFSKFYGDAWRKGVLIPLQEPFEECYEAIAPHVPSSCQWYGLGGIMKRPNGERYEIIDRMSEYFKNKSVALHLFGIYPTGKILEALVDKDTWKNVYSLDTTVLCSAVIHGQIFDMDMKRHSVGRLEGKNSSTLKHMLNVYNLNMLQMKLDCPDFGVRKANARGGVFSKVKYGSVIENNGKLSDWRSAAIALK